MDFTKLDVQDLAYCGWMEARGKGIGVVYLVMHVVCNRVKAISFPHTVHGVIQQSNAFSWTRIDDPEHGLQPKPNDPVWIAALADAPNVLGGDDDPTKGALYYANEAHVDPNGWYVRNIIGQPEKHPIIMVEGNLTFRE